MSVVRETMTGAGDRPDEAESTPEVGDCEIPVEPPCPG